MSDEKKTKAQLIAELEELRRGLATDEPGGWCSDFCDRLPLGLFRCTRSGELLRANRTLARGLGYESPDELKGVKLRGLFVHPRLRRDFFDRLKAGEGSEGYEAELKRTDGGVFRAGLTVRPEPSAGDGAEFFDGFVVDLAGEREFEETLARRVEQSAALTVLSRELYAAETVQEVLDAAADRLAEIFPTYASVNLVEEGGRYLTIRAQRVESRLLKFGEKLTGQRLDGWRVPLFEDSVVARSIRTGHPTVCGLNFAPGEPVVETDIRGLVEAMFEKKSPLLRFGDEIAERVGDVAFLGIPFTDSAGGITGSITVLSNLPFGPDEYNLIKVCADIVGKALEQKRLSRELGDSLERFRSVFENNVIGMYRTTPDGHVLMANPALVRMLGYDTFEELSERDLEKGYQPGYSRADFKRAVEEKGEIRGEESVWTRLDGTSLYVRENARAVRDEDQKTLYYEGTVEDITDRKRLEELTRIQHDLAQTLGTVSTFDEALPICVEAAIDAAGMDSGGVYLVDRTSGDLTLFYAKGLSPGFLKSASRYDANSPNTRVVMAGKPIYTLYQDLGTPLDESHRSEGLRAIAVLPISHAGEVIACLNIASHTRDDISGSARITLEVVAAQIGGAIARISAQEALKESEELYRTFTEEALVGVYIYEDDRFVFVNPRMEEITGYDQDELLKMDARGIILAEDREGVLREREEMWARGEEVPSNYRVRIRRKDGGVRVIELRVRRLPSFGAGGTAVYLGNCVDITEQVRAEEAMVDSEKRYRFLVENTYDIFYRVNLDDESYGYLSPAVEKILGYEVAEFIEMAKTGELAKRIHPDDLAMLKEDAEALRDNGRGALEKPVIEYRLRNKDGDYRWLSDARRVIFDEAGNAATIIGMSRDITERKRAEEALRESEERYRVYTEEAIVGVYIYRDKRFLFVNDEMAKITGYSKDELLAIDTGELVHEDDREFMDKRVEVQKSGDEVSTRYTMRINRKDGAVVHLTVGTRPITYEGEPAYLGNCFDTTESVRAERALRESEELYRSLIEASPDAITFTDVEGRIRMLSEKALQLYGADSEDELVGRSAFDFIAPEDQEMALENMKRVLSEGSLSSTEYRMLRKDGSHYSAEISVSLVEDAQGNPRGFIGVLRDISERKRAEEALRESVEEFRLLFENAKDAIFWADTETGAIIKCNRAAEQLLEKDREEIIGHSQTELHPPEKKEHFARMFQEHLERKGTMDEEAEIVTKTGGIKPVHISASVTLVGGRPIIQGIFRDISERKRAEEALRESEEKYRTLQANLPLGIFRSTRKGKILSVNPAFAEIFGYGSVEEAVRTPAVDLYVDPEDRRRYLTALEEEGSVSGLEVELKRRDDSTFWASLDATAIAEPGGRMTHFDGVIEDISERKRARERLHESEERYRTTLDSMGDAIHVVDSELRITLINRTLTRWAEKLGLDPVVEGKTVFEAFGFLSENVRTEYKQVFKSGETLQTTEKNVIGGKEIVTETRKIPIYEGERVSRVVTVIRDVTEQKMTEVALRESEEQYRTLQANIPVGIFRTSPEGVLISANPALVAMLGYPSEEEFGAVNVGDHYVDPLQRREFIDSLNSEGLLTDFEASMRRKDGSTFWASLNATLVQDEQGRGRYIDGILEDVTERRLAQEALRESEEFNRAVIERSPLGVSVRNRHGRLLSCNKAWRRIWAVPDKMVTEDIEREREKLEFDERDDYLTEWREDVQRVYEEGGYLHIPEAELRHPREGGAGWVSQHFYAIKDEHGVVDRVVIVTEDVTNRKETERALAASEETYRGLYETTLALADETELTDAIAVIAEQATGLLDCQQCLFLLLDPKRQVLTPIYSTRPDYRDVIMGFEVPLGVGLSGRVAETGVGHYINAGETGDIAVHAEGTDEKEDARESLISVPMFDGGRVLGVITLGKFTGLFADDDLKKLTVFARQAEIAVKRAQNLEELAASERTYHSLYETTLALADETDLIRVIEVIAKSASNLLESNKCLFFLVDERHRILRPIYTTREDYIEPLKQFQLGIGEGLSGHVAQTGTGKFVNPGDPDKALSLNIPGTDEEATERESLISVPMFDGTRVLGVITIGRFDAAFTAEDLTKLTVYARQAEIAIKRARNAEDLAKSEETYRSLYNTTAALADETDPMEVIRIIADQATALVKANDCVVYRTDTEREVLTPIYSNAPLEKDQIMSFELPLGEGLSGRVAQTGKWAFINPGDEDDFSVHVPGTDEEADEKESVLSVPMFDGGRVIGVITINKMDDTFTEDDIENMNIFARQAEIAVSRAEGLRALAESEKTYHSLYDTTLSLADESDLLKIITIICDQATEQLDSTYCIYYQYDAKEELLIPFYTNAPREREAFMAFKVPLGAGLSGAVARNLLGAYSNYTDEDRPVVNIEGTNDKVNDIESVISEPVMDGETLLSVITIGTEEKVYKDEDLAKLRIFARLASIAIKRAENLAALEQSKETYRTLYETTMTLADETDPDRVLAGIADNARDLMDAHFCNILAYDPEGEDLVPIYTNAPTSRDALMTFRLPLGVGLGGLVAQRRRGAYSNYNDEDRPVVHVEGTDDSNEHRESVLAEPIMDGETLLGVFLIHDLDRIFTDEDLAQVRIFARLTSIALKRDQYIRALSESEEKYRSLVEQATDGVVIIQNTKLIFVNTAMVHMSGYEPEEMINSAFLDFIAEEDRPRLRDLYEKRMRGEEIPSIYEITGLHKDGRRIPLELNAGLIQYDGAPADLVIIRDISERKRAEEELRESEERYRSIWTKSPTGICLSNRDGVLTMINPVLRQMLGFEEGELIGKTFFDLLAPEEDGGEMVSLLGGKFDTQVYKDELSLFSGKPTEMALVKKSGERLPVEINIDFITHDGSVQYMISLITDITERKRAEEALANYSADLEREVDAKTAELSAARRFLREVIDASPDLITVVDARGRIEILNRSATAATGYEEDEVRGGSVGIFYFDRDKEIFREMARRLNRGTPSTVRQVDLRCKDGSALTVELSVSPLLDNEGKFSGSVAVGRDIRELEGLRRALLQSEKLAATGKLAADIAHEVNNPLGIITNYLQIAKQDLDESLDTYKMIGVIEEEVQRIARIISGLLDFYRPESAFLATADVNQLIEDLLILVSIQLDKMGIEVEKDLGKNLPPVVVSPDQFRQVLLNLVTNAQDVMPDGGTLRIRTRHEDDRVVLSLSDSGGGIPEEYLPYIFDPFFTTKGKEGTGLGLSVSYGIIQSFDGIMEASSRPGEGTTFTISLPAREY